MRPWLIQKTYCQHHLIQRSTTWHNKCVSFFFETSPDLLAEQLRLDQVINLVSWVFTWFTFLCQLSRIIQEYFGYRLNLPVSCTGHQICWTYEGKHMYIKNIFQTSFDCFWHFGGKEFDIWYFVVEMAESHFFEGQEDKISNFSYFHCFKHHKKITSKVFVQY